MSDRKSLYIIDGHAQFFRAYYAIRNPMSSPVTGEPTNMVYGFTSMLLKLIREENPDYLVVVIDVAGDQDTFRSEIDSEYKANREAAPDDFGGQVDRCLEMIESLGIPVLGEPVYEADDVIASLVKRMEREQPELDIRIISRDKDLTQLITDSVELFDAHKGSTVLPDDVFKTQGMGVEPSMVADILALMGDTSDNIKGVAGIGPKTAAKLIMEFGSIDGIYENIDSIKGKRKENLLAGREQLKTSRELVTLIEDVEFDFDIKSAESIPANWELKPVTSLCKELGFNRFPTEVAAIASPPVEKKETVRQSIRGGLFDMGPDQNHPAYSAGYTCVDTKAKFKALLKHLKGVKTIAVDTETTGLNPMEAELCGISVSIGEGDGAYIPTKCPEKHLSENEVVEGLKPILEDASVAKIGHNIKYDLVVLNQAGIEVQGELHDTLIAAWLIDASRSGYSMDAVALGTLDYECISIKELIGTGKNQIKFNEVPIEDACPYASEDVDITFRLWNVFEPKLKAEGLYELYADVEMPLVRVLASMRLSGIEVDANVLEEQREVLSVRIDELKNDIEEAAPYSFNPDSPKQLSEVLFNSKSDEKPGLGLKPVKKGKSFHSTDMEVMEKLSGDASVTTPLPSLILEYRQLTKLVNTYLVGLKEAINSKTGRIHASFNQTGTSTGRLSSSDPNLQNIPIRSEIGRAMRKAFVPKKDFVFVAADYSQVELRMLAHLSNDKALIQAFEEGQDIHKAVASQVFDTPFDEVTGDQRSDAKAVNFGIVYGITKWGLARQLQCSVDYAEDVITEYKNRFKGIDSFLGDCVSFAEEHGYVETILKRRRYITQIDATNQQQRMLGERLAINSVVQGSAADLIKVAMNQVQEAFADTQVQLLLQIHDELMLEAPSQDAASVEQELIGIMESAMELNVPIVADASVGSTWAECK